MKRVVVLSLTMVAMSTSIAFAQNGGPTYQGDPGVYKVIFEDQNFRVISATWKAGATDKPHTHPIPSVIYFLTDCTQQLTAADGTKRDITSKAGTSNAVPIIAQPHTAHNVGAADCRAVFVERK